MKSLKDYTDVEIAFLVKYGLGSYIASTKKKIIAEAESRFPSMEELEKVVRDTESSPPLEGFCPRCKSPKLHRTEITYGEDAVRSGYVTLWALLEWLPSRSGDPTTVGTECMVCKHYLSRHGNRPISPFRAWWQKLVMPLLE